MDALSALVFRRHSAARLALVCIRHGSGRRIFPLPGLHDRYKS